MGADRTVNVVTNAEAMTRFKANKGYFDVMIEASGNESALRTDLNA